LNGKFQKPEIINARFSGVLYSGDVKFYISLLENVPTLQK
jgi:hypothetical protein